MTARYVFNALVLVSLTVLWSLAALVLVPFSPAFVLGRIAPWWARQVAALAGVRVEYEGPDVPLDAPAYLVMANHTSHFDALALYATLPLTMRGVAKRELGYIPIFGWALRLGVAIMIDRGDRAKAVRSIERAGRAIAGGRTVLMFPEGTRTPEGTLGALKKGPFHLAVAAGVPVLPVGLSGTGRVLPKGDWRLRPGRVRVRVGRPIPPPTGPTEGAQVAIARAVEAALKALIA